MKSKSNQTIAYDFKTRDIKVLKKLLPYLIKMRARVIWAVSFLMLAKLANVAVPLALKEIVDSLDQTNLVLILPLGMLLAYGLLRLASSLFNELRDAIFAKVRYHAMNLVGDFDQAMDILIETSNSLPSVELVVLDDWCEQSGKIPIDKIAAVQRLAESIDESICVLLTSKGSIDASGNSPDAIVARGAEAMRKAGFEVWRLERPKDGPFRTLVRPNEAVDLKLEETGFFD
mgnify:CR=1 FL=1